MDVFIYVAKIGLFLVIGMGSFAFNNKMVILLLN
jgi:hypothetical protein